MSKIFEFAVIGSGLIGSAAKSSDYIGKISSDLILDNKWDDQVNTNYLSGNYSI